MSTQTDRRQELVQLRAALRQLQNQLSRILRNFDSTYGDSTYGNEESLTRELDEMGEL